MSATPAVNVSSIIDDRPISSFNIKILAWCMFVLIFDGYDIGVLAFAAPDLIKAWNVTDRASLGPVFSASILGILFGSILFGYIGDRFGRRTAIITSCITFGVTTLAVCFVTSMNELFYLRLLTGFGLGGLFPNVAALSSEYAPKKYRATLVIISFTGVTLGVAIPGLVHTWLVPHFGWQVLFLIGGMGPLVVAAVCYFGLPESAKFLAIHRHRWDELRKLVRQLQPNLNVSSNTEFVVAESKKYSGISPVNLFRDGLAPITALLWLCFATNLMGYFFLISWLPTVLQGAKLSASDATTTTMLLQIGGVIGGWALCRPMDRIGALPIALLFVVAVIMVAAIGTAGQHSLLTLQVVVFFAGFSVLALQFGLDAISAIIYPTSIRSVGSGWAFAVGRVGSVVGPIVGGALVARNLPMNQLFMIAAIPFAVGTIGAVILIFAYNRKFGSYSMAAGGTAAAAHD